jgi:hypothetical protein
MNQIAKCRYASIIKLNNDNSKRLINNSRNKTTRKTPQERKVTTTITERIVITVIMQIVIKGQKVETKTKRSIKKNDI